MSICRCVNPLRKINDREGFFNQEKTKQSESMRGLPKKSIDQSPSKEKDQYSKIDTVTLSNYEEQYERQLENNRILKRLINPKRDKVIMRSLEEVRPKTRATCHNFSKRKERFYRISTKRKGLSSAAGNKKME